MGSKEGSRGSVEMQLIDMGFDKSLVARAVEKQPTLQRATEWILQNQHSLGARARHNPSATLSPLSKPRPALLPTGHPIFLEFEHMRARAAPPPLKRREAPFISTYPRPRPLLRAPQAA